MGRACAGWTTTEYGTGQSGWKDGFRQVVEFNTPHGLALDAADTLYVADTANHRIRRVDFTTGAWTCPCSARTRLSLTASQASHRHT
jgi:sugar lactone lactonase YvrE